MFNAEGFAQWEMELLFPILGEHHTSLEELNESYIEDVRSGYASD